MPNRITHTQVYVLDQDEALDFYVGKLGLELGTDADLGNMRWLTVTVPGRPDHEIVLASPEMGHDAETAAAIGDLVTRGAGSGLIFSVDDCRATYEELKSRDVEFTSPPTENPYGVEAIFIDGCGNWFSLTQHTQPEK